MFEWYPTESAFKQFPMRVIEGELHLQDGNSIYIPPNANMNNGWGNIGSTQDVGDPKKAMPERLELTWYSFCEDKFYTGTWLLDPQQFESLFEEGYTTDSLSMNSTYNYIIVGMAPEGFVSIWLGGDGRVKEVQRLTTPAEAVDLPFSLMVTDPDVSKHEFIDFSLEMALGSGGFDEFKSLGVPPGLWERYTHPFNWKLDVTGAGPDSIHLESFNGERVLFQRKELNGETVVVAAPRKIWVNWTTKAGIPYSAKLSFDDVEIFAALEKLSAQGNLALIIELSDSSPRAGVSLRNDEFLLPLKKVKVEGYRR